MIKVYLAGKISGEPNYKEIFEAKRLELQKEYPKRFKFICPHDFINNGKEHLQYHEILEICFEELKNCQYIYLLPNWKDSKGAIAEVEFALDNDINVFNEFFKIKE